MTPDKVRQWWALLPAEWRAAIVAGGVVLIGTAFEAATGLISLAMKQAASAPPGI